MAKKLKTGDVKRFKRGIFKEHHGINRWALVGGESPPYLVPNREYARKVKYSDEGERIERILSIGPKYVTVRISK